MYFPLYIAKRYLISKKSTNIINIISAVSVAGISKSIAENPESTDAKFVLNQIELSYQLHDIKTLYLVHHTDCGAYGGHSAFENLDTEKAKYNVDMMTTKSVIKNLIPDLEIKFVLADITKQGIDVKEL